MQSLLVRASNVHAGAAADGFQAFEDLNVGGSVALGAVARFAGRPRRLLLRIRLHVLRSFFVGVISFNRRLTLGSCRLLEHLELAHRLRGLAPVGAVGLAEEVAQSAQTESWHAILPVAGAIMAVQNNATHGEPRLLANPSNSGRLTSHARLKMARVPMATGGAALPF